MPQRLISRILNRLLPGRARAAAPPPPPAAAVSDGYRLYDPHAAEGLSGWMEDDVAARQQDAFEPLLAAVRAGSPRLDFDVAAKAVAATGEADPVIVEVGCGSGYYSETLSLLLGKRVQYRGLDYSPAMVTLARQRYPDVPFVAGDACALPFRSESCDILLSGTSLMHIAAYDEAIRESVRVSRRWCIMHTVPVMDRRATTMLTKQAYGGPVLEVIFNQGELEAALEAAGLQVRARFESIPYDLSAVLGEPTHTMTFVCEKR